MSHSEIRVISDATVAELMNNMADIEVHVRRKYLSSGRLDTETYGVTIDDYLHHLEWAKRHQLVCPESYSRQIDNVVLKTLSTDEMVSTDFDMSGRPIVGIHLAYSGSVTPIHFDWDMSEVLHLNLVGQRTVWVGAPVLGPGLPVSGNSVLMDAERLSVDQRRPLLEWFGLKPHLLRSGEAIRFPAHYWHMVEYDDSSLAISVRQEMSRDLRPLQCFARSWQTQYWLEALLQCLGSDRTRQISDLIDAAVDLGAGTVDILSPSALSMMENLVPDLSEQISKGSAWQPVFDLQEASSGNELPTFIESQGSASTLPGDFGDLVQLVLMWLFAAYDDVDIETIRVKQELLVRSYLSRSRSR